MPLIIINVTPAFHVRGQRSRAVTIRVAGYPDPTQTGKGLVTIERFLGCAESALRHISCDFENERTYYGHGGSYGARSTIQLKLFFS